MMDNEKAKMLKKTLEIFTRPANYFKNGGTTYNHVQLIEIATQALSLLDEPVCKNCGKTVTDPDGIHTCQQPPAGEFTAKIKAQFVKMGIDWDKAGATKAVVGTWPMDLVEACDRLDRLEAEKKGQQQIIDDYSKIICEQDEVYEVKKQLESQLAEKQAVIDKLAKERKQ